jgi:hypothetical protein
MPFCRARAAAKRFIAGVGGYAAGPLLTAAPSKGAPPGAAPSFSLPMMRRATSHTALIALTISCLPTNLDSRTIFKPGMGQRVPAHFVRRICVAFRRVATRAAKEHQLKRRIVSSSKESSANEIS